MLAYGHPDDKEGDRPLRLIAHARGLETRLK